MSDRSRRRTRQVEELDNSRCSRGLAVPIVVGSTDSYQDCWEPFLRLLDIYWPDRPTVYLITEAGFIDWPDVEVVQTFAETGAHQWAASIRDGIRQIDAVAFLYLQEDYFLHDFVRIDALEDLVGWFLNSSAHCLRLWEGARSGPWSPSEECSDVWEVLPDSDYLVSLQAALWKKASLLELLREGESAWEFEAFGSVRAREAAMRMVAVNRDEYRGVGREIVPYKGTGIVRGEWNYSAVVDLFRQHSISVDFTLRGFHKPPGSLFRRTLDRLIRRKA